MFMGISGWRRRSRTTDRGEKSESVVSVEAPTSAGLKLQPPPPYDLCIPRRLQPGEAKSNLWSNSPSFQLHIAKYSRGRFSSLFILFRVDSCNQMSGWQSPMHPSRCQVVHSNGNDEDCWHILNSRCLLRGNPRVLGPKRYFLPVSASSRIFCHKRRIWGTADSFWWFSHEPTLLLTLFSWH